LGQQRRCSARKVDFLDDATEMGTHGYAQRGEGDLPLAAEQRPAEVSFECSDLVRDGRLGDAA
jgi:hypothetical protein